MNVSSAMPGIGPKYTGGIGIKFNVKIFLCSLLMK
jgi:hypothetical protein